MSRLGQLEAALDPLDPSVQAIQPPVHAEQPLLDAQDLAPEVELPLLDPGHPPLQVTDVLAHALQPAVEAAEVLQDQAFGFVCHSITITRLVTVAAMARSEEHTSELQSLMRISYAVFCLKKKNQ